MPEKIQTGLRIPQSRYEELASLANGMGVSINTLALMLIDLGLKVVNFGVVEAAHAAPHNLQQNGEQYIPSDC